MSKATTTAPQWYEHKITLLEAKIQQEQLKSSSIYENSKKERHQYQQQIRKLQAEKEKLLETSQFLNSEYQKSLKLLKSSGGNLLRRPLGDCSNAKCREIGVSPIKALEVHGASQDWALLSPSEGSLRTEAIAKCRDYTVVMSDSPYEVQSSFELHCELYRTGELSKKNPLDTMKGVQVSVQERILYDESLFALVAELDCYTE